MYQHYYGLTDKPFALTPNPRFVFNSRQYREAEGQLLYGIRSREGFLLVTGQPGTGKTTLCRDLIEKLDRNQVRSALVFNPFFNATEMLEALLTEFGLTVPAGCTRLELLDRLNQFLLAQLALGRTCVAIFDEAQHLSTEFLEQIRVLSNLETDQEKLIQIILVGQPELLDKIRTPMMAQLDQRVSIRCTLNDLDEQETDRYLHHRLNVAGARGQVRFNRRAVAEIHRAARGVPRLINLVADRTLLAGFAAQTREIGVEHVRKAVAALKGEDAGTTKRGRLLRPLWRRHAALTGTAAAVIVTTAIIALWPGRARPANAEALYWKGTMESSPTAAQQALQTLIARFPQSPRVNDALVRLAQLQMARGARDEALRSLASLVGRSSAGAAHGKALMWMARVQLDGGDMVAGCGSLHAALADSILADVDLSRQFEALAPACAPRPAITTLSVDSVSLNPR